MTATTHTRALADLLSGLHFGDIPATAIAEAKLITLHTIAASIAAYPVDQTRKTIDMVQRRGGTAEATVWGSDGRKVPAQEAAFANGTLADIMDWEDCSWTGHPSAGAIPVAMAVAEARRMSGKDYLTAVVAAYEGYQRIAMAAQPSVAHLRSGKGWGLVSWQIFAASLAAGKLMNFTADQFDQLMGASLYNTIVPTNKHAEGAAKSDIYHYAHGFCARNGIVAAELTAAGFDACRGALDGQDGFWNMVSDQVDWDWHTRDFGKTWLICETYLKHWPTNMWVQTPLELLDQMIDEHGFAKDDIARIRVSPHVPFIAENYAETARGSLDAQFSIPYCLTAYLMDPKPGAHWFTEDMRNNAELIAFTGKFEHFGETRTPQDNFDEFKRGEFPLVRLEISLDDGRHLVGEMRYPKGHPKNNFTWEEEADHFRLCCSPYMSGERIEKVIAAVRDLESVADMSTVAEQCVVDRHG